MSRNWWWHWKLLPFWEGYNGGAWNTKHKCKKNRNKNKGKCIITGMIPSATCSFVSSVAVILSFSAAWTEKDKFIWSIDLIKASGFHSTICKKLDQTLGEAFAVFHKMAAHASGLHHKKARHMAYTNQLRETFTEDEKQKRWNHVITGAFKEWVSFVPKSSNQIDCLVTLHGLRLKRHVISLILISIKTTSKEKYRENCVYGFVCRLAYELNYIHATYECTYIHAIT